MLRNKADYRRNAKDSKSHQAPNHPTGFNDSCFVETITVSQKFPMASNDVRSNTAVAVGEISRSNQPLSDEARFWQVLGFSSTSAKARVTRWSRGCKSADNSFFGFQCQGVFGIDSSNCAPVQTGSSKNVVHQDFSLRDSNAGVPKQQPRKICKPEIYPNLGEEHLKGFSRNSKDSDARECNCESGHNFARTRSQSLGIHFASLTQSTSEGRF